ncbi:1,2-phenylacetyl-CoA epoxidase subunit PaaC [Pseudalkalibacillus hwajinpoensis]|uniref:Phenylacetate-CoA oxygenase subunit PaaI n=1 Tax=Guptibacillus hwajinpoensis TaxID=208199 RepID=A0A4U1MDL9_9BACL|nr:1,2-phenylacetyl-CoA epoxidase subunit PaaC [Pseudalkalibacillus hwajinpoensis]TKD68731.1 phenylacetate-CoA oxygenase subunit PaaI [Pseudalkalibacillus hwajinpoensis]
MDSGEYRNCLIELLYQLADDDFILAYRGSEWIGLAPHIEEDVAFSSISQDLMGHATLYYSLLEELGEGQADSLTHNRPPEKFHNAIILELPNGTGTYLENPDYDWGFTVVRNYFYTLAKKIRLDSIKTESYEPLQQIAKKISVEMSYHLMHWETWFNQLMNSTPEARSRMEKAIKLVLENFDGIFSYGELGDQIVKLSLIESEATLKQRWITELQKKEQIDLSMTMNKGNGRNGIHTKHLTTSLATLSEVYQSIPAAEW